MSLSFSSDLLGTYFDTNIGNDPNYETPGNFDIPTVMSGALGVDHVTVGTAGTYTTVPTASASTGAATFAVRMAFRSASTIAAAGTQYAPGNTIHLVGGTAVTPVSLTVATVKLVSATIHAAGGGTGYGNAQTFNVTVLGGTSTVAATVNVTTSAGGVVTTINSVSAAGSYTVLPTLSGNAATGDNGSAHGTGLLLDLVFGVNTFTVATAGLYTALPANPISTTVTSGSGTGLTFTGSWTVAAVVVTAPGVYDTGVAPGVTFSSGSATATAVLATATTSQTAQQKALLMIEILRSFIDEADSTAQLRDMHEIMRKMMAEMKYGASTSASGITNNFDASAIATKALDAAMKYFVGNPKRLNVGASNGTPRGITL